MIAFMRLVTVLGNWEFVAVASVLVVLYLFRNGFWRYIKPFLFVLISSEAAVFMLKHLINRPRPLDPFVSVDDPYSFPSGHANIAVVFYFSLAFLFGKIWTVDPRKRHLAWISATGIALLIGASRLILRVHHIEDVVAGFAIGLVSLYGTYRFFIQKKVR